MEGSVSEARILTPARRGFRRRIARLSVGLLDVTSGSFFDLDGDLSYHH